MSDYCNIKNLFISKTKSLYSSIPYEKTQEILEDYKSSIKQQEERLKTFEVKNYCLNIRRKIFSL